MKLLAVLMLVSLVGCAGRNPPNSISYGELRNIKYTNRDCNQIEDRISFLESQLQSRGLTNAIPEQLNENDRVYNATARIMIWNLRIGCNNPNLYTRK